MTGLVLGAAGGAGLALVLVEIINPAWFGWSIGLHWPLRTLAGQALLLLGAAVLAGLLPRRPRQPDARHGALPRCAVKASAGPGDGERGRSGADRGGVAARGRPGGARHGGFLPAAPGYRWLFPRDHWKHDGYRTEWWYFTGQLSSMTNPGRELRLPAHLLPDRAPPRTCRRSPRPGPRRISSWCTPR